MKYEKAVTPFVSDDASELFPLVDASGHTIGVATRGKCHDGSMLLHPVVHLHLFSSEGLLYLQKRPLWKDIQPGRWDTAVGGHVALGETPEEALQREAHEELGITGFDARFVKSYEFHSDRERELIYLYVATFDGEIQPSGELDGGQFWSPAEIQSQLGHGIFTPNFEGEVEAVLTLQAM